MSKKIIQPQWKVWNTEATDADRGHVVVRHVVINHDGVVSTTHYHGVIERMQDKIVAYLPEEIDGYYTTDDDGDSVWIEERINPMVLWDIGDLTIGNKCVGISAKKHKVDVNVDGMQYRIYNGTKHTTTHHGEEATELWDYLPWSEIATEHMCGRCVSQNIGIYTNADHVEAYAEAKRSIGAIATIHMVLGYKVTDHAMTPLEPMEQCHYCGEMQQEPIHMFTGIYTEGTHYANE